MYCIIHPLLDAAGNVTTEDKEKAEVLSTFSRCPQFRGKQLDIYYSIWTATSPWDLMGST